MNIAVGSKNKTKVQAVIDVFQENDIQIRGYNVPSGVSDQPFSDEETYEGAVHRAKAALEESNEDIGIGLEGGVMETKHGLLLCNWGALCTKSGQLITASGARIFLPEEISEGLRNGKELAEVIDEYTLKNDVRSNEGSIGIFTHGEVKRKEMFLHVVKLLRGQYNYYHRS